MLIFSNKKTKLSIYCKSVNLTFWFNIRYLPTIVAILKKNGRISLQLIAKIAIVRLILLPAGANLCVFCREIARISIFFR